MAIHQTAEIEERKKTFLW